MVLPRVGHEVLARHLAATSAEAGGLSASDGSNSSEVTASMRNPSTPRSRQNRMIVRSSSCTRLVAQVEAGLAGGEVVEVVLPPHVIPRPGRLSELRQPVVGLGAVGFRDRPRRSSPNIAGRPATERLNQGASIGGVVEHLIDRSRAGRDRARGRPAGRNRPSCPGPGGSPGDRPRRSRRRPRARGRTATARSHRRPRSRDVVELQRDAVQVADAVAGRVAEGARIDLVDDGGGGPGAVGQGAVSVAGT